MPRSPKRSRKTSNQRRRPTGKRRAAKGRKRKSKPSSGRWPLRLSALGLLLVSVTAVYGFYLDYKVRVKFESRRWAIPARVYARPLELYPGAAIGPKQLTSELEGLGYRKVRHPKAQASWSRNKGRFLLRTRPFDFWDGKQPSRYLDLRFKGDLLDALYDAKGRPVDLVRLEAPEIGSIYPAHNEDRVLVSHDQLPDDLVNALLAVEDRGFFDHQGVDPRSILRAAWANIRAGGIVQGGSTLTQQLVKNFYLNQERTFVRKLREAAMALILDARYGKQEILEAYANEIYLGQDGQRAIHGFGLASRFYFNRPLQELDLPRLAMLVGLVRGPSVYNPRRHPQRAKQRRDLVLKLMRQQGAISAAQAEAARQAPLGVTDKGSRNSGRFPAFVELVRRQLHRDYQEQDLTSEGLRIFTTFDPWIQRQTEQAVDDRLRRLEKSHGLPNGKLQAAAVVAASDSGELLALVGGREAGFAGFNRALDAVRPIGSLIKPVVYLSALRQPGRYTLITRLEDEPVSLRGADGQRWTPRNYDRKAHGMVPLHQALAQSYNLATVRMGLDLGVERVLELLASLGVSRQVEPLPAMLLGAVSLTPVEVTQLYQTLAADGFYTPLRAIREVFSTDGEPLQRYPLTVQQAVAPGPVYLLNTNLQEVVSKGTGRGLRNYLPASLRLAGKTGTTDNLRDSWFAGFSGDMVATVWVGRDDNAPAGLTGASGALQLWGDMMRRLSPAPLGLVRPDSVDMAWVDSRSGLLAAKYCDNALEVPFLRGSVPVTRSSCVGEEPSPSGTNIRDLFRSVFE